MCESSELSKVVGQLANCLWFLVLREAICFESLVELSHSGLRPSANPHGNQYVFVDQHVEECCRIFSVGSLSWYGCIVEWYNVEGVGKSIYNMKLNENGQLQSHAFLSAINHVKSL